MIDDNEVTGIHLYLLIAIMTSVFGIAMSGLLGLFDEALGYALMTTSIVTLVTLALGLIVLIVFDKVDGKKIVNPELDEFVKDMKTRRFLLREGHFSTSSVFIQDWKEFLMFGKRSSIVTIFRMAGHDHIYYFMLIDGSVVHTRIKTRVREK